VTFEVSSCTKFQIFRGSAPDPAGGAYSAPQTPSCLFLDKTLVIETKWPTRYHKARSSTDNTYIQATILWLYRCTQWQKCPLWYRQH